MGIERASDLVEDLQNSLDNDLDKSTEELQVMHDIYMLILMLHSSSSSSSDVGKIRSIF